jgi:sugar transferase (PEP-CTERM/EpsH1 system associated)
MPVNKRPIVVHLIYRFDVGGLERVMVNCINAMKDDEYHHVVIALTNISDFAKHLNEDVMVYQLNKKLGKDLSSHWRLFQLLRKIKPQILHTYNLAAIEYHLVAKLAGVKGNIHAEHGRDVSDPQGLNTKHNVLRRLVSSLIDFIVPVSTDLQQWLYHTVGIKPRKVVLIRNGIDIQLYHRDGNKSECLRFIHVARLNPVKNQLGLIEAFASFVNVAALTSQQASLTIVGDGELMEKLVCRTQQLGMTDHIVFTGARFDIPTLLANADVFVLSSIAEGIPMTVLEAMAAKLPVISTSVGGLPELITDHENGLLVDAQNQEQLSAAMKTYAENRDLVEKHGHEAYQFVDKNFSETAMVSAYLQLYRNVLER